MVVNMRKAVSSFLLFFLLSSVCTAYGQTRDYQVGLGLKLGSPSGLAVKWHPHPHHALELIGHTWFHGGSGGATLLYELHLRVGAERQSRFYIGLGGHAAYNRPGVYNPYSDRQTANNLYAGVDAVLGFEYVFAKVPLAISFDALPLVNFGEKTSLWWNAGVGIKYLFGR